MNDPILLAGCVITDVYGRILLLHRSKGDLGQWELPGGKLESEESPEQAAVREIAEELGIRVTLTKALGSDSFEEDGITYLYYWFKAEFTDGEPGVIETETFDDLDYVEIEDLPSLALSANMLLLQNKLLSGDVEL